MNFTVQPYGLNIEGNNNSKFSLPIFSVLLLHLRFYSIYLSISLSIYPFFSSFHPSIHPSVYQFCCLAAYMSICLPVYLSSCTSDSLTACLSVYLSFLLSIPPPPPPPLPPPPHPLPPPPSSSSPPPPPSSSSSSSPLLLLLASLNPSSACLRPFFIHHAHTNLKLTCVASAFPVTEAKEAKSRYTVKPLRLSIAVFSRVLNWDIVKL